MFTNPDCSTGLNQKPARMKKIIVTACLAALISGVSCKKDRTCECTYTVVSETSDQPGFSYTPPPPQTTSTTYHKVKKSAMVIQNCVSYQRTQTYQTSVYSGTTIVYYPVTQVVNQDCKIK